MLARERQEVAGNRGAQVHGAKAMAGSKPNHGFETRSTQGVKTLRVLAPDLTTRNNTQSWSFVRRAIVKWK
jgi:hypothetical protein